MKIRVCCIFLAGLFVLNFQSEIVHAQTTAFSYQGQLASNGVPVSGTYNLTFSLFKAASGGSAVAGPMVTNGVIVNNGLFYVTIDFGAGVWNGQTNWLQIGVETNGATSFTTLAPRQEVLPLPYAIFATSASNLLGTLPATQLSGAVALAQLPGAVVTNNETASVTLSNLTLNGTLNLPGAPVTIYSGGHPLLYADANFNFFAGPNAGNSTTSGGFNAADGALALLNNTSGASSTANGAFALEENTSGNENTASGAGASQLNQSGSYNTADGAFTLSDNVSGNFNTADGYGALHNIGLYGGEGGNDNIALGWSAGSAFTNNESSNIDIGNFGVGGESGVIRIGTPGIQTAAYIAGEIIGDGSGLTNLSGSQFGTSVTVSNMALNGTLNLPFPATIYSGNVPLIRVDNHLNFFSGLSAGQVTTSGLGNTAAGDSALYDNTSGNVNTADGSTALQYNTSGSYNTANGFGALSSNTNGSYNTADGVWSLTANTIGNNNTAVGFEALFQLGYSNGAGGTNNIALGNYAGYNFTGNENSNIDIGNMGVTGESGVIRIGTPGSQTAAYIAGEIFGNGGGLTNINALQFGAISLAQLPAGVVTNNESSSVVLDNLTLDGTLNLPAAAITSGDTLLLSADANYNFFSGRDAGEETFGSGNTADGDGALGINTSGSENTAVGTGALHDNSSGSFNTVVGDNALPFLGYVSGSGGTNNIAIGYMAGSAFIVNESSNIDIGNPGVATENNVTRIGTPGIQTAAYIAGEITGDGGGLTNLSTLNGTLNLPAAPVTINSGGSLLLRADNNLNFFAGFAGNLATSGSENTADGYETLASNTSGSDNTANGALALNSNTTGAYNTADGGAALNANVSGSDNTANGLSAASFNTSGSYNTANGASALLFNKSGNNNTADGFGALRGLGSSSEAGGTNNIALGYNAGNAFSGNESSNIDIGNIGVAGENHIIRIGTPGIQTATYLSGTVYANGVALSSDRNAKEHFVAVNALAVLDKVVALPVSQWNYKSEKNAEHIGPMAQDFHAAFELDGTDDKHISVVDENGVALAAIQGLNEKLEAENAELKKRLDELETQVKALSGKKQ